MQRDGQITRDRSINISRLSPHPILIAIHYSMRLLHAICVDGKWLGNAKHPSFLFRIVLGILRLLFTSCANRCV